MQGRITRCANSSCHRRNVQEGGADFGSPADYVSPTVLSMGLEASQELLVEPSRMLDGDLAATVRSVAVAGSYRFKAVITLR